MIYLLLLTTILLRYAASLGAVVVQLEHRFYGKSQPFADLTTASLRYLSSEQALADTATFATWFRATQQPFFNLGHHREPPRSINTTTARRSNSNAAAPAAAAGTAGKLIVFGGSYSGALASWFREKYPHIAAGAVATSAPVLAKTNFMAYHEVVGKSLEYVGGSACVEVVAAATVTIEQLLGQGASGTSRLVKDFNVCDTSDLSSKLDQSNFMATLAGNIDGVVQYNRDNRAFEGAATAPTVSDVCNVLAQGNTAERDQTPPPSDSYARYVALNSFLMNATGMPCLDVSYDGMVAEMRNTSMASTAAEGGRQWVYQTCVEFGYYQTTDAGAEQQPFGTRFPLPFWLQQCRDIYDNLMVMGAERSAEGGNYRGGLYTNYTAPNTNWTNANYGGINGRGTNTVFTNGGIDPWHSLSVTPERLDPDRENVEAISIPSTAHCANMYPASPKDPKELVIARERIRGRIEEWIQQ